LQFIIFSFTIGNLQTASISGRPLCAPTVLPCLSVCTFFLFEKESTKEKQIVGELLRRPKRLYGAYCLLCSTLSEDRLFVLTIFFIF